MRGLAFLFPTLILAVLSCSQRGITRTESVPCDLSQLKEYLSSEQTAGGFNLIFEGIVVSTDKIPQEAHAWKWRDYGFSVRASKILLSHSEVERSLTQFNYYSGEGAEQLRLGERRLFLIDKGGLGKFALLFGFTVGKGTIKEKCIDEAKSIISEYKKQRASEGVLGG